MMILRMLPKQLSGRPHFVILGLLYDRESCDYYHWVPPIGGLSDWPRDVIRRTRLAL